MSAPRLRSYLAFASVAFLAAFFLVKAVLHLKYGRSMNFDVNAIKEIQLPADRWSVQNEEGYREAGLDPANPPGANLRIRHYVGGATPHVVAVQVAKGFNPVSCYKVKGIDTAVVSEVRGLPVFRAKLSATQRIVFTGLVFDPVTKQRLERRIDGIPWPYVPKDFDFSEETGINWRHLVTDAGRFVRKKWNRSPTFAHFVGLMPNRTTDETVLCVVVTTVENDTRPEESLTVIDAAIGDFELALKFVK
ncbi:MAG: hypothetical protein SGI71_01400 [Verrucomicrobiota bacterium]|nr:hypothetical protein [Verrucomicrobiota bacterium]